MKKYFLFFIIYFQLTQTLFEQSHRNAKGKYYNFENEEEGFLNFSYLKHAFFAIFRSLKSHLKKFFYQPTYAMPTHSFVYPDPNKLIIIPVGHATVLICYKNYFIITDPIFFDVQG
jgi:hypothetical protein